MLNKLSFTLIFVFVLSLLLTSLAFAVPSEMNYQGKLTDAGGNPLNGTYDMNFRLYNASSGGNQLWNSPNGEIQSVVVTDGIYNVSLGAVEPLSEDIFAATSLYLEVAILNSSSSTWEFLAPLQRLTTTAYAFRAANADALSGFVYSDFATDDHNHDSRYVNEWQANAINSMMIVDGSITSADLATNSVYAAEIGANAVGASEIANASVGSGEIIDHSVTATDLADGTVLTEILDDDGSDSGLDADMLDGHDAVYFATTAAMFALQAQVATLQTQVNQLITLLADVTRSGDDITFSGVNVHINNGTGSTDGICNSRGNLIVGYNEGRGGSGDTRTGSHNIVVGLRQNYSSYGGLVAGQYNTLSGISSSVSGGSGNTASGDYSSVSGGRNNKASGDYSFVGGGGHSNPIYGNQAFSNLSAVLGGVANIAGNNDDPNNHGVGEMATVSGGDANRARGAWSSISGGKENYADGSLASISGGNNNTASGDYSSISGGRNNKASGDWSFVGGGGHPISLYGNVAFSNYSAVLGGSWNVAGDASDPDDHSVGELATISGGDSNRAKGGWSSVSGGRTNFADGEACSVSGGISNHCNGIASSITGGYDNDIAALNYQCNINGGSHNYIYGSYYATTTCGTNGYVQYSNNNCGP